MSRKKLSRRQFVAATALTSAALITAPYIRGAHAAGKLSIGFWDHWVPGANKASTDLVNEWAAKEKVEVSIDYIPSQGNKLLLTTQAEAQAKSGHDIIAMSTWLPHSLAEVIEPVNEIVEAENSCAALHRVNGTKYGVYRVVRCRALAQVGKAQLDLLQRLAALVEEGAFELI